MQKDRLLSVRILFSGIAVLAFAMAFLLPGAASRAVAIEDVEAASADSEEDGEAPDVIFSELADSFRKHCVRVYLQARSSEGKTPTLGDFDADIKHERPTALGGYWWDDTHVILPDPGIQDRFIRYIEVGVPGSEKLYPARFAGRFLRLQAILLKVEKNEKGDFPESHPLEFFDGDADEALSLSYGFDQGDWRIKAGTGLGSSSLGDSGVETVEVSSAGVLVDTEGFVLGLAFGDRLVVAPEDEECYWLGSETPGTPLLSSEELDAMRDTLRERLAEAVLESRFRIRIKIDEDEEDDVIPWQMDVDDEQLRSGSAEIRAAALVVGPRRLLVPIALPPEGIRRIDGIVVVLPDGREIEAEFAGALRDYMAVALDVKEDLPVGNLPDGFTSLNPLSSPDASGMTESRRPYMEYVHRWRINYSLGRRYEQADYDRWLGTFRGFRSDTLVLTRTNEEDGSLAFDRDGRLVAMAITPRLLRSQERNRRPAVKAGPAFRPLDFLAKKLSREDVFDPSLVPVDEDQGERLVDFGVEIQSLDANTAGIFKASHETRGGKIGVMVSYVYPGSMADKLGIREKDILLRLYVEGRREPMELRSSGFSYDFDSGMTLEELRSMLRFMAPVPWPTRDNIVTTLLTGAGVDRAAMIEYFRDGELKRDKFTTSYYEPDYRSAKKEKIKSLGMTVKPVTYEVKRYFGRADDSGVVISHVEDGGKSSVARLHSYQLITRVNGKVVEGLDDFMGKVRDFEEGRASFVELTVQNFGKTRLVKIE